jgi:hypothetical protein
VACRQDGTALEYASDTLKANKEVVLAACRQCGLTLQYAPDELKADKNVVMTAASSDPRSLRFAMGGLNQDRDCLVAAVRSWDSSYQPAPMHFKSPEIVLSTTFSLNANFTILLKENEYIRKGDFSVYSPNAVANHT